MNKFVTTAAFAALAIIGVVGAARAQAPGCTWAGNHWDCGDRHIYPKWYYQYPSDVIAQPGGPASAGHPSPEYYGPRPN